MERNYNLFIPFLLIMDTINTRALNEVDWVLQEAYKRAVKLRGVTDWSGFKTTQEHNEANQDVERYQLQIAQMILACLHKRL